MGLFEFIARPQGGYSACSTCTIDNDKGRSILGQLSGVVSKTVREGVATALLVILPYFTRSLAQNKMIKGQKYKLN